MEGYNFTEIGMLVGAAIGGGLSVIGFTIWNSTAAFGFALIGIALGVLMGSLIDKRFMKNN